MKKSESELSEWHNGEDVLNVIDDILQDSATSIQIIEALELRMRRIEQSTGKKSAILLDHNQDKLYLTTNE